MSSIKPSARYNSFDTRSSTSSHVSDPSLSTSDFKNNIKHFVAGNSTNRRKSPLPITKPKSTDLAPVKAKSDQNLSTVKPKAAVNRPVLVIPADFIVEDHGEERVEFYGIASKVV